MPYLQSQHLRSVQQLNHWLSPKPMEGEGAAVDTLTGLPTLGEFYRASPARIEDCLAKGIACAVAIIDIDHFRRLVETHGEEAADKIVQAIGARIGAAIEGTPHLLARLDQDEFGLLLIDIDTIAATEFCDNLREDIGEEPVLVGDDEISVTVSVGVAEVCGPETFDNYLNGAEQFLFMAKSYGRNQVLSDHTVALQAVK